MTQAIDNPAQWDQRRGEWVVRVVKLVDQLADWAAAAQWTVERGSKTISEKRAENYEVPTLLIHVGDQEIRVNPIGKLLFRAEGRVDVEARPTLNRVKLIADGSDWKIMTDSNVPIRSPWNFQSFVQLVRDLLA